MQIRSNLKSMEVLLLSIESSFFDQPDFQMFSIDILVKVSILNDHSMIFFVCTDVTIILFFKPGFCYCLFALG
jgi:hypothetical protein